MMAVIKSYISVPDAIKRATEIVDEMYDVYQLMDVNDEFIHNHFTEIKEINNKHNCYRGGKSTYNFFILGEDVFRKFVLYSFITGSEKDILKGRIITQFGGK